MLAVVSIPLLGFLILRKSQHFNLKTLFVFMTIIAIGISVSQSRRSKIRRLCERYRGEGIYFEVPNSSFDYVWQRLPNAAEVEAGSNSEWHLQQAMMSLSEFGDLAVRIRRVPVKRGSNE
jgi:hypothetical protein